MKRKLTELCDILYGYAFDSALFTDDNSYLPLARIRDVVRGYSQTYYTGEYPVQYVLKNDDLLVGMDGEFNIARWKGGKALLNQRVCKIVANEYADEDYLRFYLSRVLKEIEQRTPFVTVKHLSAKELNKVELNVPCIETQKRISKSLSLIEAIQAARQKQLRALDELVKARFIEMFGGNYYSQVTIGDVVDTSIRSVKKVFKPTDVIRYIDISSIDNKNNIMTGYVEHVLDEAPSRAQQHIQKNDIVVSTVRPNLRNVAINNYDYSNMVASSGFFVLRAIKCSPLYLKSIVCSDAFTDKMTSVVTGANYPAIKDADVLSYQIPLPSEKEQKIFDQVVHQVDALKTSVRESLAQTKTLFNSLMQQYFG